MCRTLLAALVIGAVYSPAPAAAAIQSESRTLPPGRGFLISQLALDDRRCLDPGASSRISPLAPAFVGGFQAMDNQNVCGKNAFAVGCFRASPADPDLAVGPDHVVAVVNGLVGIYGKDGACKAQVSLTNWFANPFANVIPGGIKLADPRIAFDPVGGRWIIVAMNVPSTSSAHLVVSVSTSPDPTQSWRNWALEGMLTFGVSTQPDFPDVGFDNLSAAQGGAVYLTSNQLDDDDVPQTAMLYILPKAALYAGTGFTCWRAWNPRESNGTTKAFFLRAAKMYGAGNPGDPIEYLLATQDADYLISKSDVLIWKVRPTFPPTPVDWTLHLIGGFPSTIGTYFAPPPNGADQPAACGGGRLDTHSDDTRCYGAVWRSDVIYSAFNAKKTPAGLFSAARYFGIRTTDLGLALNKSHGIDGVDHFDPAINVDPSGNVALVYARSSSSSGSPTGLVGTWYTGQLTSDIGPQTPAALQEGQTCVSASADGRWGDYLGNAIDPMNENRFWLYGSFAKDLGLSPPDANWGTWIGRVTFAPDVTLSCDASYLLVDPGGPAATSVCTVTSINGFAGNVALAPPALPAGVSGGFVPTPVTLTPGSSAQSTLFVSAAAGTSGGYYPGSVTATASGSQVVPMSTRVSSITVIASIDPAVADTAGGGVAILTGSGFQAARPASEGEGTLAGATVSIGGVPANVTSITPTTIQITVPPHASGTFDVLVTNPDSSSATLPNGFTYFDCSSTPPDAPSISGSTSVCLGSPFTLTASAGYANYQWRKGGTPIPGATSRFYSVASAAAGDAGSYTVDGVAGGCASPMSPTFAMSVAPDTVAPTVTAPSPITVDQTICCGSFGGATSASVTALATFLSGASATDVCDATPTALTPQVGGLDIAPATCFESGATSVTFRFQDDAANVGTATGDVAVRMFGDLNLDGVVDPSDWVILRDYLNFVMSPGVPPFNAPLDLADVNHDATVDPGDFVVMRDYLNFVTPCLAP